VRYRTQRVFVVVEMALAVVLLIGAGLAIRSFAHLWSVNPGFNSGNVLTFTVALPFTTANETQDEIRASVGQLTATIGAIPGLRAAALTDGAQPMNGDDEWQFWIEGKPKPPTQSEMTSALSYIVSPDYWNVMRIPLLRGRFLTAQDDAHSPRVGIIDENFAKEYFPGQDPIGKRLRIDGADEPYEIVGVVGHVNQWGLDADAGGPVKIQLYTLFQQFPDKWMSSTSFVHAFVVRTQAPNSPSVAAIRSALQRTNSELVAYDFESLEDIIAHSLASRRFAMSLLGSFAAIALLLASIGIYGVISYVVGQRTREIGIRVALGAQRSDVLRLVLGQGARLALIGIGIGLAAAAGLTRLMTTMLFGVSAIDPLTFAGVAILLCGVALGACYIPARRAVRVDPMIALRYE
jgi:predicted permease